MSDNITVNNDETPQENDLNVPEKELVLNKDTVLPSASVDGTLLLGKDKNNCDEVKDESLGNSCACANLDEQTTSALAGAINVDEHQGANSDENKLKVEDPLAISGFNDATKDDCRSSHKGVEKDENLLVEKHGNSRDINENLSIEDDGEEDKERDETKTDVQSNRRPEHVEHGPSKEEEALLGTHVSMVVVTSKSVTDQVSGEQLSNADTLSFEVPEGGWGWLVCFASFWTNGVLFGTLNVFGILFVQLVEEYKDQGDDIYFKLSWIGALQVAMTFFMSSLSSIMVDMFGIQLMSGIGAVIATTGMLISSFVNTIELLYLTYGILIGLGSSLVYTPSMTILGHYFKKRLGIVNGIVAFGSAVFTFILSTTMPLLLRNIGLRHTMHVLTGLIATLGACPFIWIPLIPRETRGLEAVVSTESIAQRCGGCVRKIKSYLNVDMFKNKGYRMWIIGVPIAFMAYFIPFVHIVAHTKQMFPEANAEIIVVCIGGISGFSRLVSGKLADIPQINRVWIMQFSFVLLGVATSLIPFAGHYGVLVFLACLMGIGDGCFICMLGPIAYDLLGPRGMGQGIGVLLSAMAIPMTIGPPLAGFIRGELGTYKIAFLLAGLPPIIGACVLFLMPQAHQAPAPPITMTDTIVSMSRDHLDRMDNSSSEEEIHIKVQKEGSTKPEAWPETDEDVTLSHQSGNKVHESNGILQTSA